MVTVIPTLLSSAQLEVRKRDRSVPRTDCRNKGSHGWGTNSFLMSPECHLIIPTTDQIIRGGCRDMMVNKQRVFPGQVFKTLLMGDLMREDLINLNNLTS